MKTILTTFAIAAFALIGSTTQADARPHHTKHSNRITISGYTPHGRPIYVEHYVAGYDYRGRPIWAKRIVRSNYRPVIRPYYVAPPRAHYRPTYRPHHRPHR